PGRVQRVPDDPTLHLRPRLDVVAGPARVQDHPGARQPVRPGPADQRPDDDEGRPAQGHAHGHEDPALDLVHEPGDRSRLRPPPRPRVPLDTVLPTNPLTDPNSEKAGRKDRNASRKPATIIRVPT